MTEYPYHAVLEKWGDLARQYAFARGNLVAPEILAVIVEESSGSGEADVRLRERRICDQRGRFHVHGLRGQSNRKHLHLAVSVNGHLPFLLPTLKRLPRTSGLANPHYS
jgi:hypothetical protein